MNLIEKVGAVAKQTDVRLPSPLSPSLFLSVFLSLSFPFPLVDNNNVSAAAVDAAS